MSPACELCRRAELTPGKRLREDLLTVIGFRRRPTAAEMFAHASAGMMRAAMGGAVTAYERHRQAYERTGDLEELHRMLRHVT